MTKTAFQLSMSLLLLFACTNPTSSRDNSSSESEENAHTETIFFDEETHEWKDKYGKCNTCTFENGFNPNGWLLTDAEKEMAIAVLEAENKYGIDLKKNRISSQEELDRLIAEVNAESSEQNQKYENVDFEELNVKLAQEDKELTAKEVMQLFYPQEVDENAEGNESIYISKPYVRNGRTDITLIHSNLLDDSINSVKYQMTLLKKDNKWEVQSLLKNWTCQEGRGSQNWGIELCK